MAIETQGFWLSLWGRTLDSSANMELQTSQPRKFLPPGTFCKPAKAFVIDVLIEEAYNIRSVAVDLPGECLPFILYTVKLADNPNAAGTNHRKLSLPTGGLIINPNRETPAKSVTLRFPVGTLLLRLERPCTENQWCRDKALIATAVPHFTANGWSRRSFHYDDPARVFQPTAIVYRDSLDAIVFVEEFNRQGDTIVTERFSLQ
jgi:hypothetical protein